MLRRPGFDGYAFAGYLDKIGCFFTDRPVAYELVREFTIEDLDVIGPLEHERWVSEKLSMGWVYGTTYRDESDSFVKKALGLDQEAMIEKRDRKALRERLRTHEDMIAEYEKLPSRDRAKDTEAMNHMLKLLQLYDGLRVYRL